MKTSAALIYHIRDLFFGHLNILLTLPQESIALKLHLTKNKCRSNKYYGDQCKLLREHQNEIFFVRSLLCSR